MSGRERGGGATYILPEGEEDHQFDARELENGLVLSDVVFDLVVELNDAVHGDCDAECVKDRNPNVGKCWIQGRAAVSFRCLCDQGQKGHADVDEAVLEDANPHYL